jgi:hypothetical protein
VCGSIGGFVGAFIRIADTAKLQQGPVALAPHLGGFRQGLECHGFGALGAFYEFLSLPAE